MSAIRFESWTNAELDVLFYVLAPRYGSVSGGSELLSQVLLEMYRRGMQIPNASVYAR